MVDGLTMKYLLIDVKDFIPVMGYELKSFKEKKNKPTIGYQLI